MSLRTVALALTAVVVATAGQLALKAGMTQVGVISMTRLGKPLELALDLIKTPLVPVGLALFVISAAFWMLVLSRVPLSFAYPFVGLTYVLIAVFGKFVLKEHVPLLRWAGIALIVIGILLVGNAGGEPAAVNATAPADSSIQH
jgi:multidrug transporter EmrE-like cation transporter